MAVLVIAACLLIGALPFFAALASVAEDPGLVWETATSARVSGLLLRTIELGLGVALVSALIGVPVARAVVRRKGPLARTLGSLVPLPLILPPWILGVAWSRYLELRGYPGAVFLLSASLWPIVALFAARGFRQAGVAADAARLARGPLSAFLHVELPLARPSILAGMLLVFVFASTDFGVCDFLSFYDTEPFTVLPMEVFQKWKNLQGAAAGAAVSIPSVVPSLLALALLLGIERRSAGTFRGTRVGSGAALRTGKATAVGLLAAVALIVLPVVVLIGWATDNPDPWAEIASTGDDTLRSVQVGVLAGLIVSVLGVAAARLSLRLGARGETLLLALILLPLAAPPVMFGVGQIRIWNHPANPLADAMYPSPLLLAVAAAGRYLPIGVLAVRALLRRQDEAPSEAAQLTGQPAWKRALAVEIPRLLPATGMAFALGYLLTLRELDLTQMVPAGSSTLISRIFGFVHISADHVTAVLCLLLLSLVLVPALAARMLGVPGLDAGPGPDA